MSPGFVSGTDCRKVARFSGSREQRERMGERGIMPLDFDVAAYEASKPFIFANCFEVSVAHDMLKVPIAQFQRPLQRCECLFDVSHEAI